MVKIGMVFVNYYTAKDIWTRVKNLADSVEVVVVDNTMESELKKFDFPDKVKIIFAGENLGYLGGVERGARELPNCDLVVVSNPDINIDIDQFVKYCNNKSFAGIGIVGPKIISLATGRDQNPYAHKRPSQKRMLVTKWFFSGQFRSYFYIGANYLSKKIRSLMPNRGETDNSKSVFAVHGCFFIMTREYLSIDDALHSPCFLFSEEYHFGDNCDVNNLDVVYDPSVSVVHEEHASTGWLRSKELLKIQRESFVHYYGKWYG